MKKVLIVLMLVAVLTAGAVVLAACGNDPPAGENYFPDGNGGNGDGTADTVVTASNSSLIGYSAATSVSALAVLGGGASSSAVQPATETLYADNFKAEFEKQLAVIGSFIDRTGITVTEGASTEEGYAHFLSVTTKGLDGEENTFVLHYNISALPDYDRDFDDDRDDWDIDNEEKFRLDGVMTYGGVTYTVTGEVENEVSADETEHEIELIASLCLEKIKHSLQHIFIVHADIRHFIVILSVFRFHYLQNDHFAVVVLRREQHDVLISFVFYRSAKLKLDIHTIFVSQNDDVVVFHHFHIIHG